METFLRPYYKNPLEGKKLKDVCANIPNNEEIHEDKELHPYTRILTETILKKLGESRMIAFFHKNSLTSEEKFEFQVELFKHNILVKEYGKKLILAAFKDTKYISLLPLFNAPTLILISPEVNVHHLHEITKKVPQITLMGKLF